MAVVVAHALIFLIPPAKAHSVEFPGCLQSVSTRIRMVNFSTRFAPANEWNRSAPLLPTGYPGSTTPFARSRIPHAKSPPLQLCEFGLRAAKTLEQEMNLGHTP
jgi:hypothetical protein